MTRGSIYVRFFLMGLRTKQRSRIYGITTEKKIPTKKKERFMQNTLPLKIFAQKPRQSTRLVGAHFSLLHLDLQTRKTKTLPQKNCSASLLAPFQQIPIHS